MTRLPGVDRLAGVPASLVTALADRLPSWLVHKVPRDHWETDAAFRRRRRVTAGVSVAGAGLLGVSLSQKPNTPEFYGLTLAVAGTWLAGGVAAGPLHLGWMRSTADTLERPLLTPVATGVGAFGVFYAAALVVRRLPVIGPAITRVLRYRGALYAAVGTDHPVLKSTAVYSLATIPTRNPALVLASLVMGLLLGLQRRATGGIQAPVLTHLTWSVLMLRYLPPLFTEDPSIDDPRSQEKR
jgi:hypothetical protein